MQKPEFRPVVVIPVYDHPATIAPMVRAVRAQGLRCLLVDDGSAAACAAELDRLRAEDPDGIELRRHAHNAGKGAAVLTGLRAAFESGSTHAVQIDADGQHDPLDIGRFLAAAEAQPEAVICGVPAYDASVPTGRLLARYLTHVWVWINTLSLQISDSMCGFRVYPLSIVCRLADEETIGQRMDFDTEILVRLVWRGHRLVNLPTPVTYPQDGISHFRLLRDNVLISRMHARLFFGMLSRLPTLLRRRWNP